jgi:hypothetical protein
MFLIFVCHPCILPIEEILDLLPNSKKVKIMSYWNSKTASFLKHDGIRWSLQKNTKQTALVIEGGDGFSSQGVTDLIGMIEGNFARDLVIVVSSVHKIPEHVLQRGTIRYSKTIPKMKENWVNYVPEPTQLEEWSRILRT